MNLVNFVYNKKDLTTRPAFEAHIRPIAKHLKDWMISEDSLIPNGINLWITISRRENKLQYYRLEEDQMIDITYKQFERGLEERRNVGKKINVFMSHGIADKNYRNFKSVRDFDYVCTSGPAWTKKYINQGIIESRILEIGYPKLDPLFDGTLKPKPNDGTKLRLLWAPTHGGKREVSSYPDCDRLIKKFPKDVEGKVSCHPRHKEDKGVTLQDLLDCDVVISDTGSLVYEAWIAGKPVIFPSWLIKEGIRKRYKPDKSNFEHQIFYSKKLGYHAKDFKDLVRLVYEAYDKGIQKSCIDFVEEIFPKKYRGNSGKRAAEAFSNIKLNPLTEEIKKASGYYATYIGKHFGYTLRGESFLRGKERVIDYKLYHRISSEPDFIIRKGDKLIERVDQEGVSTNTQN